MWYNVNMKELWRAIPGYEGLYQVSNMGNVRSEDKVIKLYNGGSWIRKGRPKKPVISKDGYLQVSLCKNGKPRTWKVHRLVAIAWLDNPNCYLEVNHKNEQKTDNRTENLEWCSRKYNINYGTARKRTGMANGKAVVQYSIEGHRMQEFYSGYEAQRRLGVLEQSINLCCRGKRQQAGGFRWKYADDKTPLPQYKPREHPVAQIKNGRTVKVYNSIQQAYRATGINNISACCRKKIPKAGGYIWEYAKI